MLNDFKTFNDSNRLDITQLVALAAYGRQLRDEYEHLNLEAPEWVDTQLKSIRREIQTRNAERVEARLKEAKARLDSLKTPTERKSEIKREIATLEKQLSAVGG